MDKALKIIASELTEFEEHFRQSVKSNVPLLDRIMRYIVKRKGKQLRPMFVLLSAKLGGEINASTYRVASLVELLHTASLVHDDVVDDSLERRSFFSINALWKNKVAVLVGDYLYSRGLILSLDNGDFRALQILTTAVKMMSEGELLQIEKARGLNLDEDIYYEIIRGKTASLLASSCAAGAYTTFGEGENVEKMRLFGEKMGMAFQVKDDLFDYGAADIGKPTGNDIKEKKLTLPLIYTLNKCAPRLKKQIIHIVKNENTNKQKVKFVIDAVESEGGIAYAQQKMVQFKNEALEILFGFEKSDVRDALEELVIYTIDRKM